MNTQDDKATAPKFDLEERTAIYAEKIIAFARRIPSSPVFLPIVTQLSKAGTSIGANYNEANEAESKKDFRHKIALCLKEARETKYWLRLVGKSLPELRDDARILWTEAKELTLIFAAIRRSCDGKSTTR